MVEAVVVGAGPNGIAAAIAIARAGHSVLVVEAKEKIGGGATTEQLTLPGFHHDVCSAIHPLGILSPFLASIRLEEHGVEWIHPPLALAHPFDDGTAAVLETGLEATARRLAPDSAEWTALFGPFADVQTLYSEILRPLRVPKHPVMLARFGFSALQSAERVVQRFRAEPAKAIFAGCAAHAMMPLEAAATSSFGLVLAAAAHAVGWPLPRRGSAAIIEALAKELHALGGAIETGRHITSLRELPAEAKAVLFDVMPRTLAEIAGDDLPASYSSALRRYRQGPGVFKIDWALSGPIPWKATECRQAGTVHVGGPFAEIAASERAPHEGRVPDRPFVLVAQQSLFDATRAPDGKHTGWAYCHVPNASTVDMTDAIEAQVERFAPGFRDLVLARHTRNAAQLESHNPTFLGGDIGGGKNDLLQTLARPFPRWDPYATPNPRLYLASSATPPGGGVHGMCGYWAAR
ncbi:MAG: NAD(P)/FAD-dependent oxidoreductase, partial [Myxococcota bacterium]|nr:NAD(P)/FAD-dependent oxidoreductase [Myxococcota bacterium]